MLLIYNILLFLILIVFAPLLFCVILLKEKYRARILKRLGFGLTTGLNIQQNRKGKKTVWLHALSVGEVTSAVPLVKGIRGEMDDIFLIFTTSTKSGGKLAEGLLSSHVDILLESPIDILPVIRFFLKKIQPDVFILVETDFWPNLLFSLQRRNIDSFLVNGRISKKSMRSYQRFDFFFRSLFDTFSALCMQTVTDKQNMVRLGINEKKIHTLGNLKYDTPMLHNESTSFIVNNLPQHTLLWVCGSTHNGEEEILLSTYKKLKKVHPGLYLILAPRNNDRGREIKRLGQSMGLRGSLRSKQEPCGPDFYILDTIGELAGLYHLADIAFVGGSLVNEGGHNPIEAAVAQIPVLFGAHMEDFEEIGNSLVRAGGAFRVKDGDELYRTLDMLLQSDTKRKNCGQNGLNEIQQQRGVIHRHIELIKNYL